MIRRNNDGTGDALFCIRSMTAFLTYKLEAAGKKDLFQSLPVYWNHFGHLGPYRSRMFFKGNPGRSAPVFITVPISSLFKDFVERSHVSSSGKK